MSKSFVAALAAGIALTGGVTPALAEPFEGFYAGAVVGGRVNGEKKIETVGTPAFAGLVAPGIAPGALNAKSDGAVYGAVAGYSWRLDNGIVAGLEGELNGGESGKSASFSGAPIPGLAPGAAGIATSARREQNFGGALRARVGAEISPKLLAYATGGIAFGETKLSASVVSNNTPAARWDGSEKKTKTGYVIGAGLEYAISPRVNLRGEYLYTDLGDTTVLAAGNAVVRSVAALNGVDYRARAKFQDGVLRAGVTFNF
ncbi:MAG: outer membrane beta-barrel protein [Alphaproteobacteria bacterium]|nr:outer membrane beta-barrel protein [Alphaproteobacteria bacterium]